MKKEGKIVISKNGPYVVSGNIPLKKVAIVADENGDSVDYKKEKDYPEKNSYCLCRCGRSSNPPYCDTTHIDINFQGKEVADREKYIDSAKKIEGPKLGLTDKESLCSLTRFCHNKKGDTWNLTKKSNKEENKKEAIRQACKCTSGRLVAWDNNEAIELSLKKTIAVIYDGQKKMLGPLSVTGEIKVESFDGYIYEKRNRVTLCRCGKSKNMPFCDASHLLT